MPSAIHMLPYTYTVRGLLKGRKKPDSYVVRDTVPISIPAVGDADAPVAALARIRSSGEPFVTHRAWKDRFVAPLSSPARTNHAGASELDLRELPAILASEDFLDWPDYPLPTHRYDRTVMSWDATSFDALEFKSIAHSDMEEQQQAARLIGDGFVVVDGVLHAPAPEMRWELSPHRHALMLTVGRSFDEAANHPFRADRLDIALNAAGLMARASGRRSPPPLHDLEDMGLVPWRHDDVREAIVRSHRCIMGSITSLSGETFSRMPAAFYPGLVEMRDIVPASIAPSAFATATMTLHEAMAEGDDGDSPCTHLRRTTGACLMRMRAEGLLLASSTLEDDLKGFGP